MAKSCYICDKQVAHGGKRKHKYGGGWKYRAQRITRKFSVNMRQTTINENGKEKKIDICMKCYKRLRKKEAS